MLRERLRIVRKELNLSQDAFAKKLGVTGPAISKIEKGERNMSDQLFLSICREFNVNPKYLRSGLEPKFLSPKGDFIARAAQQYGLDAFSEQTIRTFVQLPPAIRNVIMGYIKTLAKEYMEIETRQIADADTDEVLEAVRREMEQKKAIPMSVALPVTE